MLPEKIAFLDIETTGMRSFYDRVIEIGIIRLENNKITNIFHSLINPQSHIPPEITRLTGISSSQLENAPTFRQIKDDILETVRDCVIAAHNVRFDYSFLKNEFQRMETPFSFKHFCTVRLSRLLYPRYRHHNLDSLINRFGFNIANRHRALDDAKILVSFYQKIRDEFPPEILESSIKIALKKPSLPLNLNPKKLESLPENPGVYIFYGKSSLPIYIGKSINIRERVLSHFASDLRSPLEMKISRQIENIETIRTTGELGALILESHLIKKMLPLYNQKSRVKYELTAILKTISPQGYQTTNLKTLTNSDLAWHPPFNFQKIYEQITPKIKEFNTHKQLYDIDNTESSIPGLESVLGFFKSRLQAKNFLSETAARYNLCSKLLGLEKTTGACFTYRLGKCKGACLDKENPLTYNIRFIMAFSKTKLKPWPFKKTIAIEETNNFSHEYFIINKWILLGSIKIDKDGNENKFNSHQPLFDLDTYKILKQYLFNPKNLNKIRVLN
jgi:DNA polymerase-3 subunit epsilon